MFNFKVYENLEEFSKKVSKAFGEAVDQAFKATINRAIIESPPFMSDSKGGAYDDGKSASRKIKPGVIKRQKQKIVNQILGKGFSGVIPSAPATANGNPALKDVEHSTRHLGLVLLRKAATPLERKNAKKARVIRSAHEAVEHIKKSTKFNDKGSRVLKRGYKSRFVLKGALEKAANQFAKRAGNFVSGWLNIQRKLKNEKLLLAAIKNQQVDKKGTGSVKHIGDKHSLKATADYSNITGGIANYLKGVAGRVTKNIAKYLSNAISHINFRKIAREIKNRNK